MAEHALNNKRYGELSCWLFAIAVDFSAFVALTV